MPECPVCSKDVRENADGSLRAHGPRNNLCPGGRRPVRGTPEEKGREYVRQGRARLAMTTGAIRAVEVQGSRKEPYDVIWNGVAWWCDCEARVPRCAHVHAAMILVPDPPTRAKIQEPSELDVLFQGEPRPEEPDPEPDEEPEETFLRRA